MISAIIRGQYLSLTVPVIAADTLNYLTARFAFKTADWDGLVKIAHFSNGTDAADVELTGDEIRAEDGLNLTDGTWRLSVTGHEFSGGELVKRITTTVAEFAVHPSGVPDGEPVPSLPSYGERILAEVENIHTEVDEQLDEQNAAVDERLDENEAAVAAMLGAVKNRRDGSFLQIWAGSEEQYAAAEKSADTIYLIGLIGGDNG